MSRTGKSRKRRFRRLTLRVQVEVSSAAGRSAETATTLGAGGLFIQTASPLSRGAPLELRFQLPGSARTHALAGRVVWANRAEDGNAHSPGMGIEFTDRAAISELARELDQLP